MTEQHPFKWRHFQPEIILLCVRWYLRYALSYRDLEEMMQERGLSVDHTTIYQRLKDESMKHTSTSKKSGPISTEPSILWETRSSFSSVPYEMLRLPSAFLSKREVLST